MVFLIRSNFRDNSSACVVQIKLDELIAVTERPATG